MSTKLNLALAFAVSALTTSITASAKPVPHEAPIYAEGSADHISATRARTIHECSVAEPAQYVWGVTEIENYRTCMAGHGQIE